MHSRVLDRSRRLRLCDGHRRLESWRRTTKPNRRCWIDGKGSVRRQNGKALRPLCRTLPCARSSSPSRKCRRNIKRPPAKRRSNANPKKKTPSRWHDTWQYVSWIFLCSIPLVKTKSATSTLHIVFEPTRVVLDQFMECTKAWKTKT